MEKLFRNKKGVSVKAYKGDAMTLLAMNLDKSLIENFTGFTIRVTPPSDPGGPERKPFFLFNRFTYDDDVLKKNNIDLKKVQFITTDLFPIQKFRWVHTPATNHNINLMIFGKYVYEITPRYLVDDMLQPLDHSLTVKFSFDISPFRKGNFQIGFTRGFIESQAYSRHFGLNNNTRPNKTDLIFDIQAKSGPRDVDKKKNPALADYTFEDQHRWLGWQARERLIELLQETLANKDLSLDVFAFDLDEPVICDTIIKLAKEGRARVILDNSDGHTKAGRFEIKFAALYNEQAADNKTLARGCFKALAHSKVFIQKLKSKPCKVLTGSTNFSTNGIYINANHVLVFTDKEVAKLYENVFDKCFSQSLMDEFSKTEFAINDSLFTKVKIPDITIRFSPHSKTVAEKFFKLIHDRILQAKSDVLFAIMKDSSQSSILDAVMEQVKSDKIFTYGITDTIGDKTKIFLYKPDSKRGVRIAGRPGQFILPPPFDKENDIPGISVHHKFVVVDFKGSNPVVYCGSSNLAFTPEQRNGDNLLEIRDADTVTAFAVEAIRLVDHFQFRNAQFLAQQKNTDSNKKPSTIHLHGSKEKNWVKAYYDKDDLLFLERTLLIK